MYWFKQLQIYHYDYNNDSKKPRKKFNPETQTYNARIQIWTGDTRIFNPLLYQLSYLGKIGAYSVTAAY